MNISSKNRRFVKIDDIVNRFLRKSFCFFIRMFSISGSMQMSRRVLLIFAAIEGRLYFGSSWLFPDHSSGGKGGCSASFICLLCADYILCSSIRAGGRRMFFPILLGVIHQDWKLSCFEFFISTTSIFSCVKSPGLMSTWLLIIFMIFEWSATLGNFPQSRFLKFCFYKCIRSSWLIAFSLTLAVIFLLLTSFSDCHAILDFLSSTESLILLIWSWMCSFCFLLFFFFFGFC